ncbi:head morphogenesis protein [Rhodanobacter fulvus Jip2]|uniref:Head morphogenesis protein n=1 Tax=Rhodanobacter fulvus Jip2 TaxID=1163408 RepID=I4VMU9_9GAMM|nr:phage minor head protein [Rhodanobacter fulvus]EIL88540.1 head morphogenesis protein [Rhodanobacter fulvus Jip2]
MARQIDDLVRGQFGEDTDPAEVTPRIVETLQRYASTLTSWAGSVADRMILDVDRLDRQEWMSRSEEIGRGLMDEILHAPTGEAFRDIQARQVALIRSLPTDAAERVQKLAMEAVVGGTRAKDVAAEIMRTGEVTKSRANLIAVTEVSRAQTGLVQARSMFVGSVEYDWITAGDTDVRPDHRRLSGKIIRWDDPPIADTRNGARAHAGCIYRCRCWAKPRIPGVN